MRLRRFYTLLCLGMLSAQSINAQSIIYEKKRILKISPLGLLASRLVGAYEQSINSKFSWHVGVGFIGGKSTIKNDTLSNNCAGLFLVPEGRYYINKLGPSGLYVSALARVYYMREKQNDLVHQNNALETDYSRRRITSSIGIGAMLGYQYIHNHIVFDIAGGLLNNRRVISTNYNDPKIDDYSFNLNRSPVDPLDHDKIGFRFTFTVGYILNDKKNKKSIGFVHRNERVGIAQRY